MDDTHVIPKNSGGNTSYIRRFETLTPATNPLKDDTNSGYAQLLEAYAQEVSVELYGAYIKDTDMNKSMSYID